MAADEVVGGWRRRRLMSAWLRLLVMLVPVAVSIGVAFALNRAVPSTSDTLVAFGRAVVIAVCSLAALVMTDAWARRFLPLATLLQLSLVFPDRTPSRFKTALKNGSGRRLAREVELMRRNGISDEPARASEQLLLLATAIGDHDRRTRGHSERVRLYTDLIAEELNIPADERAKLQWAALIHDIGKIEVPPEILNKKGRPDAKEWAILQDHPLAGEILAAPVESWLGDAFHAVGGHHERWDGTGYPRGLVGEAIPRAATIVAVADSFEVMTAVRSYKAPMSLEDARNELTRCAGTHFSPEAVRALLNVSIGPLRRAMGILAVVGQLPFMGKATKAAAYAPDSVSTAVGITTSTAATSAGVLAITGVLTVAPFHAAASTSMSVTKSTVSTSSTTSSTTAASTSAPPAVRSSSTADQHSRVTPASTTPTTTTSTTPPSTSTTTPEPPPAATTEPPVSAAVQAPVLTAPAPPTTAPEPPTTAAPVALPTAPAPPTTAAPAPTTTTGGNDDDDDDDEIDDDDDDDNDDDDDDDDDDD